MSFLKQGENFTLLHIKITHNSSQNQICGIHKNEKSQEYLKIRIAAQPIEGKANEELIKFLAKLLKIPKSKFEIVSGEIAKIKTVKVLEKIELSVLKI